MLPGFSEIIPYFAALCFVVAYIKQPTIARVSPIQNGLGVCLVVPLILDPPDRWAGYGQEGPSPAMIFLMLLGLVVTLIRLGRSNHFLPLNHE